MRRGTYTRGERTPAAVLARCGDLAAADDYCI
jgi:hypothetical protein